MCRLPVEKLSTHSTGSSLSLLPWFHDEFHDMRSAMLEGEVAKSAERLQAMEDLRSAEAADHAASARQWARDAADPHMFHNVSRLSHSI